MHSSPTSDLTLNPHPLDIHSLELLHHYILSTSISLTPSKGLQVWRLTVPSMGLTHSFLMHAILAVSALHLTALHLTTLQPHRKTELTTVAFTSEALVLPSFRQCLASNDPEDIHVIFAFSSFVTPYLLFVAGHFDGGRIPSIGDTEAHLFFTMRGIAALLRDNWVPILQGPRAIMDMTPGPILFEYNPDDVYLAQLHVILIPKDEDSEEEKRDLEILRSALDELRRVTAVPCAPSRTIGHGVSVCVWPGSVSQEYIELLDMRRPEALVILAHYCVLIKNVNELWYLRGTGEKLLEAIKRELGEEWKGHIQWPLNRLSKKDTGITSLFA